MPDKLSGQRDTRFVAVEPTAAPSLTGGRYRYDFGDSAATTPLIKMYTLGHSFVPAPIHAGGLRYHGMAPLICHLRDLGVIEALAVPQVPVFEAAQLFADRGDRARAGARARRAGRLDEALRCKEAGESKVIAINLCGHGRFDMQAYRSFLDGQLVNYEYPQERITEALAELPPVG